MPHPVAYTERKQWEDKQYHFLQHQKDPAQPKEMFGMRPRFPDPRDVLLAEADPRICEVIAAGLPDGGDLSRFVVVGYNQGQIPACFPAGTFVRLADGSERRIEEIRLLDEVVTAEGRTGKVLATMVRREGAPLRRLELWGHRHLLMTPEHPVLTRRGYVPVSDLQPGDWVALTRYLPNRISAIRPNDYIRPEEVAKVQQEGRRRYANRHGDPIDRRVDRLPDQIELDADFGRIIGLFLAEGSAHHAGVKWTFSLYEAKTLAQELTNLLRDRFGLDPHVQIREGSHQVNIEVFGKHWYLLFKRLCATGSGNKRLHPDLCSGPAPFLHAVFEGWMDGDGHLKANGERQGVTVSHELAIGMYDIAQALGLCPAIRTSKCKPTHNVKSRRDRWDILVRTEPEDSYRCEQDTNHTWRKVVAVSEEAGTEGRYVYNLHVEGDNSYVAEGIGVHNCVSHTLAGGQSAQQMQEEGVRRVFDAMRAHNETGPVNQGRYPDQMMRYWKDTGLAEVGTGKKFHLENYAWIMNGPNWFDEICAAIVLEKFLGMAYLVPQYFSYESDGDITSGYHESLLCGFRRGANAGLLGKNSWGDNWGRNGFFWLSKKYLESHNFHNGLIIVHSLVSVKESGPTPPPPPPPPPPPVTDKEAESFRLVNDYRRGKGLGLLVVDERLARAARKHSQDMAARGYESHTSPDGTTPISRMQAEGVTANAYGENIGWGQSTAEQVHNEWLASPGHKANLDFAAFNKIGVGYHAGGRFGHYWTHNFVFIPNGGPPPPPQTLKVTGYQPAEVASGKNFQILGQGFGVGVLFVSWGGQVLVVNRGGDTTITATAPIVTEARTAAVAVRLEGATAEGPPLTIRPEPPPDDGPVIERLEPPEAERGEGVTVVGKQFGSTGGRIFVVGAEAPALNWGPTRAHFLVPGAAALGQSFVELRRADGKSFTASFTVLENSPPPTDDLVVQGVARFYGRGLCYVWAYVRDKAGMYVKGKVEGTLGDLVLPSRLTGGVTTWALRNANFPHQVRLTLTARSGDRSGTFSGEF